jgi:hypothetical protein
LEKECVNGKPIRPYNFIAVVFEAKEKPLKFSRVEYH